MRLALRESLEDIGHTQHAEAGNDPADHRSAWGGHQRDILRHGEDAGAHSAANDQTDKGAKPDGARIVGDQDLRGGRLSVSLHLS